MIGAIVGFIAFLAAWPLIDNMFIWPIAFIADLILWVIVAAIVNNIVDGMKSRP